MQMNTNWVAQLAPEHAPAPPGWWPPALGWWAVAAFGALLIAAAIWWWRDPRRVLRRAALNELQRIRADGGNASETACAIELLLRRYAIAVCGPDRTARLSGEAWLTFAASVGGEAFAGDVGRSLLLATYRSGAPEDHAQYRERWLSAAETFLRRAARRRRRVLP
jgi:hypothetical protein